MRRARTTVLGRVALVAGLLASADAFAADGTHHDPSAKFAASLAVILLAAKLGGEAAVRLGQAAVLGELLAGVLLGNLHLFGTSYFQEFAHDPYIDLFARLGVLLLLFEVGLESTIRQLLEVGLPSLLVAVTGVAVPFAVGWGAAALLLPSAGTNTHAFVGATLTATSVGITARVLKDLGQSKSAEARVILGAAVIDDVLGLVILAVVSAAVSATAGSGGLDASAIGTIVGKSLFFLVGALAIGAWGTPRLFRAAANLRVSGVLLTLGLSFCLVMAWLADVMGLAPIVGAFAAGLILEEAHSRTYVERGELSLGGLLHPISTFLVPVFFVVMGMRTELETFASLTVLGLAAVLCLVAILGKVVSGVAVGPRLNRLAVGIGMVPRGEVGLIFANVGVSLSVHGQPVIDRNLFSAIVVMVIVTTLLTPSLLKWALATRAVPPSKPVAQPRRTRRRRR